MRTLAAAQSIECVGQRTLLMLTVLVTLAGCGHFSVETPDPRTYDEEDLQRVDFAELALLAELACLAYDDCGEMNWRDFQKAHPGFSAPEKFVAKKHDIPYFIVTDTASGTMYLSIRGTETWDDWRTNASFDADQDERLQLKFHIGFKSVADEIYRAVRNRFTGAQVVYLTGHSQGGAAAAILALVLKAHELQDKDVRLITFAAPKYTNLTGAMVANRLLGKHVLRVMHDCDVVPQEPNVPRSFAFNIGFRHSGPGIYLLGRNRWSFVPEEFALAEVHTDLPVRDPLLAKKIHSMDTVLDLLSKLSRAGAKATHRHEYPACLFQD